MCYASSCNPRCGKCYPKKIIDINCPECGAAMEVRRESYLNIFELPHKKSILEKKMIERDALDKPVCKNCGADITETLRQAVQPEECKRSRIVCGFPCGGKNEAPREGARPCQHMVPLARLHD